MKCAVRANALLGKAFAYSLNYLAIVQKLLALFRWHSALHSKEEGIRGAPEEAEGPTLVVFAGLLSYLRARHDITDSSPMESTRQLLFSKEISVLKCMLKLHSPLLYKHLKRISIPLEALLYDHVTSLFALTYPSETVFRVWDMLFLEINTFATRRESAKDILETLVATAFSLLAEADSDILEAKCHLEVENAV